MTEQAFVTDEPPKPKPDFFPSEAASAMQNLFETCRKFQHFGMIVGISGMRKSTTAREYARTHQGAVYCRMSKPAAKLQPGLVHIANATHTGLPSTGASDIFAAICNELRDNGGLLILDEAQHMEDDLIEAVRDLWDETRIGIVFVANPSLKDRLEDGRNGYKFAQLTGRIRPVLNLKSLPDREVDAMSAHFGVEGKQAGAIVRKVSQAPGGLHNAASLLRIARELAGTSTIGLDHVKQAAMLSGGAA